MPNFQHLPTDLQNYISGMYTLPFYKFVDYSHTNFETQEEFIFIQPVVIRGGVMILGDEKIVSASLSNLCSTENEEEYDADCSDCSDYYL